MNIKTTVSKIPIVGSIARYGYYKCAPYITPLIGYEFQNRSIKERIEILEKRKIQEKNGYPNNIAFEPISKCILDCEFCIIRDLGTWKYRRNTRMEFDEFKKIIDDIAFFTTDIQFSGGEPLLNKDIFKMLKYSRERNIFTLLATNAQLVGYSNNLEHIMEDPPDKMLISYESIEKETYETIRRKGKFNILMENINNLIEEKKRRKQKRPIIILQMVLTKKNMHQLDMFWYSVKELGADYGSVKALGVWPEGNEEYQKKMAQEFIVPKSESPISRHDIDDNGNIICYRQLGECPAVKHCFMGSGGEVYPCWYIVTKMPSFGNAVDENFIQIWNSDNYTKYRHKMLNDWAHPLCQKCIGVGASSEQRKMK